MCYQKLKAIVFQDQITPILAESVTMNNLTNLGEFCGPAVDAATIMTCCKCGQNTSLIAGAPGATSCNSCGHYECNDCDFN
ncbi:uncharacterized protein EAE98_008790 [Botrytis deweyae]|uniref:IBR domain-containing protein n=1 Tax=Botrytis deweyae TaxID=2478750 RepID=A0ABQ7ID53_9HELO|nr:uncharacterized protein EAE98_008790 [Botrytis deweyae]KAF7911557.1 hypothetical protein EAE99_011111 [Botrytis elliptica]KAF7920761.1 hypothetical protein EAE98_008790 [Botrytis deweyae]